MRQSATSVLLLALAAIAGPARAQDSTRQVAPPAANSVVARKCTKWRSEGILVIAADARAPGAAAAPYFTRLARLMERRLEHQAPDSTVLVASFAARIFRSGEVGDLRLLRGSDRAGFDMDAQRAATFRANDPDLEPMPAGIPDSLTVLISFGRRLDGSDFLVSHVACQATQLPGSPPPAYPTTVTLSRARYQVRVRYTVDPLGTVDTATVTFVDQTNEAFGIATLVYLANLRFLPAEFDGERRAEVIAQLIVFVPPGGESAETR